jgi:hypothetical protein
MKYKTLKLLAAALSVFSFYAAPALAHEMDETPVKDETTVTKEDCPKPPPRDQHREDTDYTRTFREGTLNLVSPFTWKPDMFYILFSHNYFVSTFPRGSNPHFGFNYTPVKNLQLDALFTLRAPTEFEAGVKYQIFNEFEGDPISLAPRVSFNTRGSILGLDVSATKIFFGDVWQLGLGYRLLGYLGDSKVDDLNGNFVHGIGANTIIRFWKHWHLFGDIVLPFDSSLIARNGFIWSAGIKKRLPGTPHILTLYVGNSNESTISGRTISTGNGKYPDMLKVGFNFSIGISNFSNFLEKLF